MGKEGRGSKRRTFFDAGAQIRQFLISFEGRWVFRIGYGGKQFLAEAGQDGSIVQDVEACDAQGSFGGFHPGRDHGECLVLQMDHGELFGG